MENEKDGVNFINTETAAKEEAKLDTCPFCSARMLVGEYSFHNRESGWQSYYYLNCQHCGYSFGVYMSVVTKEYQFKYTDKDELFKAFNSRAARSDERQEVGQESAEKCALEILSYFGIAGTPRQFERDKEYLTAKIHEAIQAELLALRAEFDGLREMVGEAANIRFHNEAMEAERGNAISYDFIKQGAGGKWTAHRAPYHFIERDGNDERLYFDSPLSAYRALKTAGAKETV